ncbi:MAG: protein kinase, partial [Sulfurimonas sp. RIFCSPLOWO2_12_FULL_36_74]
MIQNIKSSAFSLAKGRDLTSDDFYAVLSSGSITIAIVCDGVGSAEAGGEAAKRTANYLLNNFKIRPRAWSIEKSIRTFISAINSILYQESMVNYERAELLTTLSLVVIEGNRLYGANVGDSRVYLHRNGSLTQLSFDHVMQEGSHILTQAIGGEKSVEPFYFENILSQNDKIVLCSDGLYNTLSLDLLEKNIHFGAHSLVKKASSLVNDNLDDDTTAVVVEILQMSELEILKHQKLPIPYQLKKEQIIDGYKLEKSLIPNDRTWLCSKKTKEYVLKFPSPEAIDDEKVLDFFVKEAWNAKRLKADFFPKAVIPKNRTQRYYVMQLIRGENLGDMLQKKNLTIDDAVELGGVLLDMSQFLLKSDLVHGDIKPQNIMLETDGQNITFKVIDFGS